MKVSTPKALKQYQNALKEWLKRGGLNGAGGSFNRTEKRYERAPEPTPEAFGIEGFALKASGQIKAKCVAEHERMQSLTPQS